MRRAILSSLPREGRGTSITANIPAPVGGWNTRDSVAELDPLDATLLDNWVIRAGECQLRGGSTSWATGMSGGVKSIFGYNSPAGTSKMFAATNAGIYDITSGGAVGAVVMALTNGYINGVQFTNSAGTAYWWGANGADNVKLYDGTTWSTVSGAITGVSAANIVAPWLFKHRVMFIEKNTLSAWFLPLDSIQGAAVKIPLGNFFRRGGHLIAGTSWTLDSGDGVDDLCVFITSEGEVAVYRGADPSSASSWALVGVFYVGKPLGRRCFTRLGGDVGVLVESGFYPLSKLLRTGNINFASALSNKIQPTFSSSVVTNGILTEGWEAAVYPAYDQVLVNVPIATSAIQFIMNTVTGGWSSFSGWNASCFLPTSSALYWGVAGVGTVMKAWDGLLVADSGADIVATVKQAATYFGRHTMLKHIALFRPQLSYDGNVETRWGISSDFEDANFNSVYPRNAFVAGATWDTDPWDTSAWAISAYRFKNWRAVRHNPGYALALWLQTASKNSTLSWSGTDFIVAEGGAI